MRQVQPVPRARKVAAAKPTKTKWSARIGLSRWPRRRVVLAGVLAVAATGIAVNALVLQSARHPAPLFAAVEQARQDAARQEAARAEAARKPAATRTAEAPRPPSRPPETAAAVAPAPLQASPIAPAPVIAPPASEQQSLARLMTDASEKPARATSSTRAAEKPVAEKPPAPKPSQGDALADMIRGGIVPPGGVPSEPDPKIQQVQRFLASRGMTSAKPDGFMGPATRAAIEKYERDKKWPVTGEMSARLTREAGTVAASGR